MKRCRQFVLFLSLFLLVAPVVEAARPGLWETESIKDWLEGEFEGTGLTSEAKILPTFPASQSDIPARIAWGSVVMNDRRFVGTSLPAGIFEVGTDGVAVKIHPSDELGFTALTRWQGAVYAASTPSGGIYRLESGDTGFQRISTVSDSYVWSMHPGPDGEALYLATGPSGTLYRYEGTGSPTPVTRTPGTNIMALANFGGHLFLGDDAGGLYRLERGDSLESVYGFKNGEIAALASDDDYLYVGVNHQKISTKKNRKEEARSKLAEQLKQQVLQQQMARNLSAGTAADASDSPAPVQTESDILMEAIREQSRQQGSGLFSELSGTLVYRMDPPKRMNVIYNDPEEIVHDLEAHEQTLFVATGGKGRLYKIRPDFTRIAYYQSNQKLVTDVQLKNGEVESLTTGEGAGLVVSGSFSAGATRYRSPTFDAHLLARWGALRITGQGPISVRTRSGNTNRADTQWSTWTEWQTGEELTVTSPPARFLQYEVRFEEPESEVSRVGIAYQIPNQRPRLTNLVISPNPVHQLLMKDSGSSSGKNGNNASQTPSEPTRALFEQSLPEHRQIRWNVMDPDGDPVQSKLYYRPLDGEQWVPLNNDQFFSDSSYTLKTRQFADGRYRLKVVSTDRAYNDPGHGFTTEKVSEPLLIDNTAPRVENLQVDDSQVRFRARDQLSTVLLVQYRINHSPWQALLPEDGILDQESEQFAFTLDDSVKSGDLLQIRVLDGTGNRGQRNKTLSSNEFSE